MMIPQRQTERRRSPLLVPLALAAVLFAAHTTTAFNEPETKEERRKRLSVPAATRDLIEWIGSETTGGYYYKMQKELIRDYKENTDSHGPDGENHGTYAIRKPIPKNTMLLMLPMDRLLGGSGSGIGASSSSSSVPPECRLIRAIYEEVTEHGENSEHAPHLRYLGLLGDGEDAVPPKPPILWSDAGRKFLEDLGQLPPGGIARPLARLAKLGCLEGLDNGGAALATKIAAAVAIHGAAPTLIEDHGVLVPLFDNYHYSHCGNNDEEMVDVAGDLPAFSLPGSTTNADPNTRMLVDPYYSRSVMLLSTREIPLMDQICRPFGAAPDRTRTATERLVDLGISDSQHYPKIFVLDVDGLEHGVEIEVTHKPTGREGASQLSATVTTKNRRTEEYFEKVEIFLEDELRRLRGFGTNGEKSSIPRKEYGAVAAHHRNLVQAMELAYAVLDEQGIDEDEDEDGGGGEL